MENLWNDTNTEKPSDTVHHRYHTNWALNENRLRAERSVTKSPGHETICGSHDT
jgi:hypothetical protein